MNNGEKFYSLFLVSFMVFFYLHLYLGNFSTDTQKPMKSKHEFIDETSYPDNAIK
jgi:hypothetical protein